MKNKTRSSKTRSERQNETNTFEGRFAFLFSKQSGESRNGQVPGLVALGPVPGLDFFNDII